MTPNPSEKKLTGGIGIKKFDILADHPTKNCRVATQKQTKTYCCIFEEDITPLVFHVEKDSSNFNGQTFQ